MVDEFDMMQTEKFLDWIDAMQRGAIAHALDKKPHEAVQAYAQAAAFKYVYDAVISGSFDVDLSGASASVN